MFRGIIINVRTLIEENRQNSIKTFLLNLFFYTIKVFHIGANDQSLIKIKSHFLLLVKLDPRMSFEKFHRYKRGAICIIV